jgi:hypothetical protein
MKTVGRRIHIAGSGNRTTERGLLEYGHEIIARLADSVLVNGASLIVGLGREPLSDENDASSPALVFDWTVLERTGAFVQAGGAPATEQGPLIAAVASSRTEAQIPQQRQELWQQLRHAGAVQLDFLDAGWSSGAVRRQHLARLGDVLIILSGGEGVEQLAELYVQAGKPVIPLDLDLGASTEDGAGGASRLHARALTTPSEFVRLVDPSQAGVLLSNLSSRGGQRRAEDVVGAIEKLIAALQPPSVFLVRLLNTGLPEYDSVERFFRNVVDPVVRELGGVPFETGSDRTEYAWMNEEIFDALHYSSVAVVDLTGLRNNCFMELGYAMGRGLRVIVTAMNGTRPPFDAQMIPHHFWEDTSDDDARRKALKEFWTKYIDRPQLVRPRSVL